MSSHSLLPLSNLLPVSLVDYKFVDVTMNLLHTWLFCWVSFPFCFNEPRVSAPGQLFFRGSVHNEVNSPHCFAFCLAQWLPRGSLVFINSLTYTKLKKNILIKALISFVMFLNVERLSLFLWGFLGGLCPRPASPSLRKVLRDSLSRAPPHPYSRFCSNFLVRTSLSAIIFYTH